ncbi:T9SS type A sorting domain-containing protein [Candidatus Fermentibacteria bacterium]|nr:T9SS type A sorting domain-containing protein [Candidatus Fermentibacteria bacterium]
MLRIADAQYFTINDAPTFLYQMAYLGLTAIPTESPEVPPPPLDMYGSWTGVLTAQLECIRAHGINCVRVWTHWGHWLDDLQCTMYPTPPDAHNPTHWDRIFAMTDQWGRCDDAPEDTRPLYQRNMNRLRRVLELCDDLGLVVELTFARPPSDFVPWAWPYPQSHPAHCVAVHAVCNRIQSWRGGDRQFKNIYFDLDNESWGTPDRISVEDIAELVSIVKDPSHESTDGEHYRWLCTCSWGPCQWEPPESIAAKLDSYMEAGLNFASLNMNGGPGDPARCMDMIRDVRAAMEYLVPIHVCEPFRVGNFWGFVPDESDFYRACTGVRVGGGVGWCLHTMFYSIYGNYYVTRGDLTYSCINEGNDERGDPWGITEAVFNDMMGHFGSPDPLDPRIRRFQAEYDEQLRPTAEDAGHPVFTPVGRPYPSSQSYGPAPWGWEARPDDGEGLITWGPDLTSTSIGWGAAILRMTWMGSAVTRDTIATVHVWDRWDGGQKELGHAAIHGDDLGSPGQYVDVPVLFYCVDSTTVEIDVDVRTLGRATLRLDYIQLELPAPATVCSGPGVAGGPSSSSLKPRLASAAPNPFRRGLKLAFALPVRSTVSLTVFDVAGREVAWPASNRMMGPGTHWVFWEPETLPRGIYTCRLVVGGHTETMRLVYLGKR